jgi:hypothetical protein
MLNFRGMGVILCYLVGILSLLGEQSGLRPRSLPAARLIRKLQSTALDKLALCVEWLGSLANSPIEALTASLALTDDLVPAGLLLNPRIEHSNDRFV